jgi:ABC-type multidrug transport system fused ATPase/permease subunit
MSAFTKFGKQLEVFYDLSAAIDKLGTLIDLPLERAGGEASLPASGPMGLSVRDVSVRYDGGGAASHVRFPSFDLRAGERLGVTGPTGAGKSTLADVIFGLRVPATGTVIVDGVDLRAVPLEQLRGQIAIVRGVELFPGSILDNVRLGRAHVSYEDVVEALRTVGLLDDLVALPDGLDTELQPHGRPLSNRQSALLMVARAIVGTPRLLILDGVLDHVDGHGQRSALADVLLAAGRPWTLLCISDRAEMLARCDRVLTLDDGSSTRAAE